MHHLQAGSIKRTTCRQRLATLRHYVFLVIPILVFIMHADHVLCEVKTEVFLHRFECQRQNLCLSEASMKLIEHGAEDAFFGTT